MRKPVTFLLLLSILLNLTGCYDARGLEDFAYVIAIGIDSSETDDLELSLQFATSGNSNSDNSSESSSQSKKTNLTTVKCKSIDGGIALINGHISKKVNLSHCQVIIISEEIAKKGISQYIETLMNNVELRSDCSLIISKCQAKEYINNVEPALESLTARFYKSSLNSAEYTGYTTDITLSQFYTKMKDTCCEGYAILGNTTTPQKIETESSIINANQTAGNIPIQDKDVIDNLGIAVFKGDVLVGELTGLDSLCHVLVTNKLKECTLSIPSPFEENKFIDFSLYNKKCPDLTVYLDDKNIPHISVEIFVEGNGLSLDDTLYYFSEDSLDVSKESNISKDPLKVLNTSIDSYLEEQIESYLLKTSKEYSSDICSFGKYLVSNYLTLDEWYNSNWLDNYKNSVFSVKVHTNIKSGNIFSSP